MRVVRDILTHVSGRAFGELELILSFVVAFAFWCLDFAVIEWRSRRSHALVLALAGLGIIGLVLLPRWAVADLVRIGLAGLVLYLPFYVVSSRHRRRQDAP